MIEPIRRVLGARPGGVAPVPALRPLERVQREPRREDEEAAEERPPRRPRRPHAPADGHVDVQA